MWRALLTAGALAALGCGSEVQVLSPGGTGGDGVGAGAGAGAAAHGGATGTGGAAAHGGAPGMGGAAAHGGVAGDGGVGGLDPCLAPGEIVAKSVSSDVPGFVGGLEISPAQEVVLAVEVDGGFSGPDYTRVLWRDTAGHDTHVVDWSGCRNYPRHLAVSAAGDVYVVGTQEGSVSAGGLEVPFGTNYLVKLTPAGEPEWARGYSSLDAVHGYFDTAAVAAGGDDSVIVMGLVKGPADFGGGVLPGDDIFDLFVLKLDSSGNYLWAKRFDFGTDMSWDISAGPSGEIVLSGLLDGLLDLGDGIEVDGMGGFVAKLSSDGAALWGALSDGSFVSATALGPDGEIYAAHGCFGAPTDGCIARLDGETGAVLHVDDVQAELPGFDPWAIGVDTCGNALVADVNNDKVVKRGPNGERLATWTLSPGQDVEYSGGDLGWSATVDPEGGVWLADTLCGTVDFGPGPVSGELMPILVHFVQQ
jgi:hypothetical protein